MHSTVAALAVMAVGYELAWVLFDGLPRQQRARALRLDRRAADARWLACSTARGKLALP
jgi:hypothetical protein